MWWMMTAPAAEVDTDTKTRTEASLAAFSIPDETDEEFADFMFSRKSSCSESIEEAADET